MSRLAEIIAYKRQEIAPWLNHTEDWEKRAQGDRHFRNFRLALEMAPFGFIAEVKRASPSAGIIAEEKKEKAKEYKQNRKIHGHKKK